MPQMAPYSWLMLMIYFNIIILMHIIYTHSFNSSPGKHPDNKFIYKPFKIKW